MNRRAFFGAAAAVALAPVAVPAPATGGVVRSVARYRVGEQPLPLFVAFKGPAAPSYRIAIRASELAVSPGKIIATIDEIVHRG